MSPRGTARNSRAAR